VRFGTVHALAPGVIQLFPGEEIMEPIEYAELAGDSASPRVRGSIVEQLLSPQTLQRMMACSGGLLVLGFVGWLWSIGLFKEPLVAAVAIGVANLTVLGIGMSLVKFSRYQLAGGGLTLLASLAMPLNLWFYDAQGLVTLANGGHLWMPAAVCCGIYALIAHTLRKPMFVYTLVGGLVMTGLLILADQKVNCFWQLMPQVSFLIGLGWVSYFAERLLPDDESDFSRRKFGYAFRWAGLPVLAAGFVMLLGGQLAGFTADVFSLSKIPLVATSEPHQLWAIGLLFGSAVLFALDRIAGTESRTSTIAAISLTAWSGLTALDLFSIQLQLPHFAITLGVVYIASLLRRVVVAQYTVDSGDVERGREILDFQPVAIAGLSFFGVLQLFAQYVVEPAHIVFAQAGPLVVAQMLVTVAACYVASRKSIGFDHNSTIYLCLSSIFAVLSGVSVAAAFDITNIDVLAGLGFIAPAACIAGGLLLAKPHRVKDWQLAGIASASVMLVCVVIAAFELTPTHVHLTSAWILGGMGMILFGSSIGRKAYVSSRLCYLFAVASFSQVLAHFGFSTDYSLVLSATISGVGLLVVGLLTKTGRDESNKDSKWGSFEEAGNTLVFIGSVTGFLLSINRLFGREESFALLGLLVFQVAAIVFAGLMASTRNWRLTFRAAGVMNVLGGVAIVNNLVVAHAAQRVELCSLLIGIALLVLGHIAWYREGEKHDETATLSLWGGSLLLSVPLAIGLLYYRSFEVNTILNWWFFHEAAAIGTALALLALGLSCRIRSTTICGAGLLTTYVVSVVTMIQWPGQLKSVSLVMMVGGGLFFVIALVLSIYRDRLLSIPSDIREGNGMFKVLRWR